MKASADTVVSKFWDRASEVVATSLKHGAITADLIAFWHLEFEGSVQRADVADAILTTLERRVREADDDEEREALRQVLLA